MDYTVHGILQARILEWVAFPFSRWFSQPREWTQSPASQLNSSPAEPPGKPKNTGAYPSSSGSSWPRNRTGVSCIAGGFFTNWAIREAPETEKWKWKSLSHVGLCIPMDYTGQNTGVSSLSFLQGIFLTQESNRGLPHCRQILYQLSYQENPFESGMVLKMKVI